MNMAMTPKAFTQDAPSGTDVTTTSVLDAAGLLALGPEWEELVEHALEENAYYSRRYSKALLSHIEKRPLKAITVWKGETLIALLPFVSDRLHWGGLTSLNKAWTTDYTTTSIPLIDGRWMDEAVCALLDAMGATCTGGDAWLLPNMSLEGPVNRALKTEMSKRDLPSQTFDPFERAVLTKRGSFEDHMKEHVSKKRRKDLRRNRKRLDDLGEVTWTAHDSGPELDEAIDAFLKIEASGWKGERGTALDCTDATRAFAKEAFGDRGGKGITRADVLRLDGNPVAINLTLVTGNTGFTVKCAYDAAYRGQSVGLLLEEEMIRSVLEDDWIGRLDSSAVSGHLITSFWNDTIKIGDILIDTRVGAASARFGALSLLEKLRRSLRTTAKGLFNRLRS
jgi:CelD/BcsL family acetyltransferase involved in cellulose biosynthesis|tara:strand:+ start:318 stop:1499 length:1182 start_codon:yes stop_codon:yes gene_type:complete